MRDKKYTREIFKRPFLSKVNNIECTAKKIVFGKGLNEFFLKICTCTL